ncbi:MAG: 16S rRNA (cytosine(1402)-N(4))-methyltransferase RsmH [Parachlamydiales bacterium]|nr:16S rRNA (cytosine(1402)-N(4))-methyltransferase RsmH [Parachlamydiales bacterium]
MNQINQTQKIRHFPVLLKEFLSFFENVSINSFFDGTLGAAGHAEALLEAHDEIEIFIGCDQDKEALNIASDCLKRYMNKVSLFHENYKNIDKILNEMNIKTVDGVFLDLGVSSMQLDVAERGFSFRFDAPLDMRMNKDEPLSAKDIVNEYSEIELEKIFKEYGEEHRAKKAAKQIVLKRKKKPIITTFDLIEVLEPVLGKRRRIHPVTKIFQALRICVNDELNVLKQGLENAIGRLSHGGIIGVISFHSLEDRIVKHTFKENKTLQVLTKKPIQSGYEEKNPRARSAKMRFAKKI